MSQVDELTILIRAETAKAVAGMKDVGRATEKAGDKAKKAGKKFKDAGKKMSMMATLPIAAFIGSSVKKFNEQEKAIAEVNSTIDSMGVAWTTTAEMQQRAADLQSKTTFGDEEILHMQSVLLTFGDITEDVFASTEAIALDMSAALGQDLQSSAVMLGKALNDPIVGLSALSRVGVSFSEDQKDMIKAMAEGGDMIGAQTLMMEALESQFEGSAAAVAATAGGQMQQAMNSFGDTMETVGGIVAPILVSIMGFVSDLAGKFDKLSGPVQKIIVGFVLLVAAIGPILYIGGLVMTLFGALASAASFVAAGVALITLPMLAVVAAIAAAIAIGWLIYKNWDTIFSFVKNLIDTVFGFVQDKVETVMGFIQPLIETALGAIQAVWETVFGVIKAVVLFIFDAIKLYFTVWFKVLETIFFVALWAIQALVSKVMEFIQGVWEAIWNAIGDTVKEIWDTIKGAVSTAINFVKSTIKTVMDTIKGAWDSTLGKMFTKIKDVFTDIKNKVKEIWESVLSWVTEKIDKFKEIFTTGFTTLKDTIADIWNGLAGIIKDAFKGAMNWVIDKINAAIRIVNGLTGAMNKIPGVNIGTIPEMPNLGFGGQDLGGSFMVGDRGLPEMVTLPQGSAVTPLAPGDNGGGGIEIHLNAPQNDPAGVAAEIGWELTKRGM